MEFAKAYDPKEAEENHYKKWEESGCFTPEINENPEAENIQSSFRRRTSREICIWDTRSSIRLWTRSRAGNGCRAIKLVSGRN